MSRAHGFGGLAFGTAGLVLVTAAVIAAPRLAAAPAHGEQASSTTGTLLAVDGGMAGLRLPS